MPTILSGLVDDADILSNERVIDMDDEISMLDPDTSQFTTMLMKVSSNPAFSSKVEWLEDELFPRLTALDSAGITAAGQTALTAATGEGAYLRAGDVLRVATTGEALEVTAVSGDAFTVVRSIGTVAAATAAGSAQLVIIGNASLQGATLGTKKQTKRVAQFNYTQIQRNPYGFTKTLVASKLYGGPVPQKERRKKAVEHKRAIELTLFWGARELDTGGSEPQGFCGGLFEYISTNVKNASGVLTKSLLDDYFRDFLQHGSRNKVMFASPLVAQAISGFLRDAWQPNEVGARLWGAFVDGFISGAYGYRVPVIVKRDWNDFSSASGQFGGWAFVVDMDNVALRPLRATKQERDRQANDADSYDEEYITEYSFQIEQEKSHGLIKGVTG